jgi:predicted NBD/HSP70 family sugar kinase
MTEALGTVRGAGELLQQLRDGTPRTRADLIELTGLARSTVGLRVDALLAAGLLQPHGQSRSTGGRPPARFAFRPDVRLVLAADYGATHGRAAITDLTGAVLAEERTDLAIADGPEPALDWLVAAGSRLMAQVGQPMHHLAGVGIGLPGPVEHTSGRPIKPPIMPGWDGFDVAGWVGSRIGVRTLVDNDVNLMALGEHALAYPDVEHLLFVKVATGIGAGIISGGRLHRGADGSAGDLGHVQAPGADTPCDCGNLGCLEAIASSRAIAAELGRLGKSAKGTRGVLDLLLQGDTEAMAAVRRAGREIGTVLASCVSLLNPSVIVVGGSLADGAPSLLAGIREVIYARSLPLATGHLLVVPARTGEHAGVMGAAEMVIQRFLAPESIDALLAESA